jgi:hypothetical protein
MIGWSMTTPNCAVNGLATLLGREEWRIHADGELIRQELKPLLDSQDTTIRIIATMALPLLVDRKELPHDLAERLGRENNESVIEVLTQCMAAHATSDPIGIDTSLHTLSEKPSWAVLAGADEPTAIPLNQRNSEISDALLQALLHLYLVCSTPFTSSLMMKWIDHPLSNPATIGRLATWTRPYLNPPTANDSTEQARAFALLTSLTDACRAITVPAVKTLTSGQTLDETQQKELDSAVWITDSIAREIYHASGAFRMPQERSEADNRLPAPSFCSYAFPLIEQLAEIPRASIVHHLVKTLVFLSRSDPRRALLAIAKATAPGSGYEYEPVGEEAVLDLLDQYLAERREVILGDADCLRALQQMLNTFVGIGSDRAIHRVQDLGELFKLSSRSGYRQSGVRPGGRASRPYSATPQARAVYLSGMLPADKPRALEELSEPLQVALTALWPGTRVRALARLPRLLDKFAADQDDASARPAAPSGDSPPAET